MKKKVLALFLVLSMAAAMTGCGQSESTETAKETDVEKTVQETEAQEPEKAETAGDGTVLNVVFGGNSETYQKEYITDTMMGDFEKENNCTVNIDFMVQEDVNKKIKSEQDTGNIVSDVVFIDTANMANYVNGDWMEDITDIVDASGCTYTDMFDDITNKDGKRYFVPMSFDVYLLGCNIKALDYLPDGLTREDVEKGITWEQYADWAIAIAKGEGQGKTMMPTNMTKSQLLYPMGGMSLAYGGGFPDFNSQGFKDAMGVIAKMAAGDAFYAQQDQYTTPTDPLNSGDVWLSYAHMVALGASYNAAPNNFVIGAAPKGSQGAGSTAGAWCFGIQKGAQNQELAEKFIEYVTDPDVDYEYCYTYGGALSPIAEVADNLESDDVIMRAGSEMLASTIISGVPATEYTDWNAVKLLYGDVFNKILETKAVPDDAFLDEIQSKLEALKITE